MRTIPLTHGKVTLVDDEDYERFGHVTWRVWNNTCGYFYVSNRYSLGKGRRKRRLLHREIIGAPPGMVVDHINHDTLDNRKENLRLCTRSQNGMNRKGPPSNSTSGVRGVSWKKQYKNNEIILF